MTTNAQITTDAVTAVDSMCGSIRLELVSQRCTVRLVGDIDANMSWAEIQRLVEAVRSAALPVHVDCAAVTFFGSEGLSVLALLKHVAPGGYLAELVVSPAVQIVVDAFPEGAYTSQPGS